MSDVLVTSCDPGFTLEVIGGPLRAVPLPSSDPREVPGRSPTTPFERALHGHDRDPMGRILGILTRVGSLPGGWRELHVVAEPRASQYDLLVERLRDPGDVPDRVLVLGGWGGGFHGQRGRAWVGLRGNLHLSAHVALDHPLEAIGVGLHALAAVSLVEAIDELPGPAGRAGIKWVNDVYLGDAKVAGFLAHASSQRGRVQGVVLGIGVNVARAPEIPAGDRIVRRATALADHVDPARGASLPDFLPRITGRLGANLAVLLDRGPGPLVDAYRSRSLVVGRRVRVHTDPVDGDAEPGVTGTVIGIGDDLSLLLEGVGAPVREGRLELLDDAPAT